MSEAAAVILNLKQNQCSDLPQHKLTHREVRKLLKKERRRFKRKQAATKDEELNCEHDNGSDDDEDEEYLRSKNLWLMRENQIRKRQEQEAKRKSAEKKVREIVVKRGLDQG